LSLTVVRVDEKGRVTIPSTIRDAAGIKTGTKLLVRLREDGSIELIPLDKLYERVSKTFREKLGDWREEEHEATKLLNELVRRRGDN